MNAFTSDLCLKSDRPPAGFYTLLSDLVYESEKYGTIIAPAGLVTDFASIPRIAYTWMDPESPVIRYPSVIHDGLYNAGGKLIATTLTREQCDDVLREAMIACGARYTQAAVVYRAVRMFGGSHWKPLP